MKNFFEIYWFEEVSSTMEIAREFALKGREVAVVAETQKAGRGRLGRRWLSPKGGLWLSISLVRDVYSEQVSLLPYLASLAACFAIEKSSGIKPFIKWPNDLLFQNKKLAGILLETSIKENRLNYAVLGIGINVNNLPPPEEKRAISLREILGKEVDRLSLLTELLKMVKELLSKSRKELITLWESRCSTIGKKVRVLIPQGEIIGIAKGLSQKGGLLIIDEEGNMREVLSGDCIHLF